MHCFARRSSQILFEATAERETFRPASWDGCIAWADRTLSARTQLSGRSVLQSTCHLVLWFLDRFILFLASFELVCFTAVGREDRSGDSSEFSR